MSHGLDLLFLSLKQNKHVWLHSLPNLTPSSHTNISRNEDPTIRGLALRALLSLNLLSILEYVVPPLQRSLTDRNPYVRKTGVMGVLKLARLSPMSVVENGFVAKLETMLKDTDPQVVINALLVLNELVRDRSFVNRALILNLLNRIKTFNEWGQCVVINLTSQYKPVDQDETFAIMNLLDGSLHVNNSAVVLAAIKCMLRLTVTIPEIHKQVYLRIKTPLLTLMTNTFEVVFCVLSHILVLLPKCDGVFDDEYKQFFCRYNEPSHVKNLKLEILSQIANRSNCMAIANELGEYIASTDDSIAKVQVHFLLHVLYVYVLIRAYIARYCIFRVTRITS
jgi:AP-4 complex subunit beta-1